MKVIGKYLLFFTIVIGAFLRLYQLNFQCLYIDEVYTQYVSGFPILDIIHISIVHDFTPPLYYLISHFIDMRLASAIFGIFLIPVMYFIGEKYKDELTGLYCAGTTSVFMPLVLYSQFGRQYSLTILLFAITIYFYIGYMSDKKYGKYFCISSIACIYCSIINAIPIILLILTLRYGRVAYLFIIGIFTSPLLIMVKNMISERTHANTPFGNTPLEMIYITPVELFGSFFIPSWILIIIGYYRDRSNLMSNLLIVSVFTMIIGFSLSFVMPFFSHYYIMIDVIFLLLISTVFRDMTMVAKTESLQAIVFIIILSCVLIIQYPDLIVQYTTQRYTCM